MDQNWGWAETESLDRWISQRENSRGELKIKNLQGDPETDTFFALALGAIILLALIVLTGFAIADAEWGTSHFITTGIVCLIPGLFATGLGWSAIASRASDYKTYREELYEASKRPDSKYYGAKS